MNDPATGPHPGLTHMYRRKLSVGLPMMLLMAPLRLLALAVGIYGLVLLAVHAGLRPPGVFCLIIPLPAMLLFIASQAYLLAYHVGNPLFSYLKVSPGGLEYRSWPVRHLRCGWEGVQRMGQTPAWGSAYEMVRLTGAEVLQNGMFIKTVRRRPRLFPRGQLDYFYLTGFRGYPDGALADDLRRYAPHLFTAEDK
jgi:hypothetical protein